MDTPTGYRNGRSDTPVALRFALALAVPFIITLTVTGTYLGYEVIVAAAWAGLITVALLFVNPVIGIGVMTSAYMLAAYPTLLQSLGVLTLNNLLGVGFVILLTGHVLDRRDLSFLWMKHFFVLAVICIIFLLATYHSESLFPLLQVTRGKRVALDKTSDMAHDLITRLVFLVFFWVYVRSKKDLHVMFIVFMSSLFVAVPSALVNWMQGNLISGFRAAASVTSGANPNRLALICLIEVACWWFWALARPGLIRRLVAYGAIGASILLVFASGSRSGLLGVGVLLFVLQTGPRRFHVPLTQVALVGVVAGLVIVAAVPPDSWERMLNFFPAPGTHGAHSTMQREDTIKLGFHMISDHPLLGIGLGNFREVSRQVYHDPYYRPPHNSYLWACAEGGILTFAAYVVLFWILWRDIAAINRLTHRDPDIGYMGAALRAVFVLYNFFALFADLWINPVTYVLIGLAMTIRRYLESLPEPAAAVTRSTRPLPAAA